MSDTLTFLGTCDGLASADRNHTSLLLRLAGKNILIDCGQPCSQTLKKMRVDFNSIDAIVITHSHSDHIGGLPMLLQSIWLEKRERPLPIHVPAGILAPLQSWLRHCYLFDELLPFPIEWHPLQAGARFEIGSITGTTTPTSHLDRYRSKFADKYPEVAFDAFSFLFEAGGKRLLFSGDLGDPNDLAAVMNDPLDVLAVELAHFPPAKLIDFLKDKSISHVAITHINRTLREMLPEVRQTFARDLPRQQLSFVNDGDVILF